MQFNFDLIKKKYFKKFILLLILFIDPTASNILIPSALVNKYYDKRIPDEETFLTEIDFQQIRQRRDDSNFFMHFQASDVDDSAMYSKKHFEGDIANPGLNAKSISNFIDDESEYFVNGVKSNGKIKETSKLEGVMRNAVRSSYLRWPNARVPYTISKQYTLQGREKIAEAIKEYNEKTCVNFTPKADSDIDYVHILPDEGCYSLVGKVGGKQPVSLGDGCIQKGIIIHELMHSIGFFHEQSRADRDQYIKIIWDNVEKGLEDQFDKYSLKIIDHLGAKYDYGSVMHYGSKAFSSNGKPTIETYENDIKIGQRNGFSETDLYKINKLYACSEKNNNDFQSQVKMIKSEITTPQPLSNIFSSSGNILTSVNIIPPTTQSTGCFDLRNDCESLAMRGHCESLFSNIFMLNNCAKTCEKCFDSNLINQNVENCKDSRTWCLGWAATGLCEFYPFQQYMHSKCMLSCHVCK